MGATLLKERATLLQGKYPSTGDEKELLPAHKALLGTASDVLPPPSPLGRVPDVEVSAFKAMLSFIYADDLRGLNGGNAIAVLYAEIDGPEERMVRREERHGDFGSRSDCGQIYQSLMIRKEGTNPTNRNF
uniref:BTB domain-containing protein n=1 Tax=Globodera rostochiensis TaxID=31243 RepID=A0A914HCQ1_GLORO